MKTALFTNFSDQPFTGYWDGKPKTFKPGQALYMPAYLAEHYAKHLTNRELLRLKPDGSPVYKDGEKLTSPKKPKDVPQYMELFNRAYQEDQDEEMVAAGDDIDVAIETSNRNRGTDSGADEAQIIVPPADDEDDNDDFGGSPVEASPAPAPVAPVVEEKIVVGT